MKPALGESWLNSDTSKVNLKLLVRWCDASWTLNLNAASQRRRLCVTVGSKSKRLGPDQSDGQTHHFDNRTCHFALPRRHWRPYVA